jgi:RNA polymerase sigma-70 factor (ECF subfamily)
MTTGIENPMKNSIPREDELRHQMVGLLPRLRRFARTLAKDPDKADDLVQAACERALNRLDQLREGTRLDSWLYRIIYTQWIDRLRRHSTRSAKLVVLAKESQTDVAADHAGAQLDTAIDLRKALRILPEEHNVALMLVCVEGYSYAEAAAVMDVPAGTVASRVARARNMLGRILFEEPRKVLQTLKGDGMEGKK